MSNTVEKTNAKSDDVMSVVRGLRRPPVSATWNGVEFKVKHRLNAEEALKFVNVIIGATAPDSENYHPELVRIGEAYATLSFYTDFPVSENSTDIYELSWCNDLFEIIKEHIDVEQYDELTSSARKMVVNALSNNTHVAVKKTCDRMSTLMTTLELFVDNLSKISEKADKIDFSVFDKLHDMLGNVNASGDNGTD